MGSVHWGAGIVLPYSYFLFLLFHLSQGLRKLRLLPYIYQGWAPRSFAFRTFRSFAFKKENVTFFYVLFRVFGDLWNPKERYVLFRSFQKNGKERKERNVLFKRTEKNAKNVTFFWKERKRTRERNVLLQRTEKNVPFFLKNITFFFEIYIEIYIDIYRYI